MSTILTYSEAKQNPASLLEKAIREGAVRVRRIDGQVFFIVLEVTNGSQLNIKGVDLDLTQDEIVEFIHEERKFS